MLSFQRKYIRAFDKVLVFVFPLYVDSIPSQLLQFLIILGELKDLNHDMMVYCVVNNGFFEGTQNYIAIQQMKNWCAAANLKWGQGVGIGAGEMLPFISDVPLKHGPNKKIEILERGGSFNLRKNDLDIENVIFIPLNNWFDKFKSE